MRIRPRSALAVAVILSLLLACAMSVSALRDQGDSPSKMVRLRQFPKAALKRTAEATAQPSPSPSPSPSQPRFSEVHQQQQNQQRQRIAAQMKAKQQASVRNDAFFGAEDDYPTYVLTDNPNANIFRSLTPWGQVNPNNVLQTLTPPIRKMNKDWHLSVQEMGINTRGVREIDSKESIAPHGMSPVMPSWDYPLAPRAADFPLRSFEASKSDPFPIMEFLEVESKAGSRASSHTSAEASASASSRATARVRGQERLAQRTNVAAAEALKALQHHTAQLGGYPGEKPFKGGVGGSLQNAFYGGGGQAPSWVLPQTPVGSPFPSRLKTGYHIDPSEVHLYPLTPPLGIEYADKRSPKDRYMPMFARYTSDYGLGAFSFIQQAEEIARHQNEAAQRYYDHVLAEHEKRRAAAQPNA